MLAHLVLGPRFEKHCSQQVHAELEAAVFAHQESPQKNSKGAFLGEFYVHWLPTKM